MKLLPSPSVYQDGHPPSPHPLGQPNWCCSALLQLNSSCSLAFHVLLCCKEPVDPSWAVPCSCLCPLVAQFPLPGIAVPGVHVGSLPGSSLYLFSPCLWQREPLTGRLGGVIWLKIILIWMSCKIQGGPTEYKRQWCCLWEPWDKYCMGLRAAEGQCLLRNSS